jgi:hypothetical protein
MRAIRTISLGLPKTFPLRATSTATARLTSASFAHPTAHGIDKTARTASSLPSNSAPMATNRRRRRFGIDWSASILACSGLPKSTAVAACPTVSAFFFFRGGCASERSFRPLKRAYVRRAAATVRQSQTALRSGLAQKKRLLPQAGRDACLSPSRKSTSYRESCVISGKLVFQTTR